MPPRSAQVAAAVEHLQSTDKVMRRMIERVGPYTLRLQRDRFGSLVRAIIAQQISSSAARSIHQRLLDLVGPDGLTPRRLARLRAEQFRGVGISPQKAAYLGDLSQRAARGSLRLDQIGRYDDEAVIEQLVEVKGIGRWTAQMFLIFSLGRFDVFPHDDLGVRVAIRDHYGLPDLPDKQASCAIAEPWRPYASIASWYCWRAVELKRAK